jgi:hypothetical protein
VVALGRVVGRIIRGWDTCLTCGFAVGRGGRVVEGSWTLGSTSDSGSRGIWVRVALVGRVAERIMRVCSCAGIWGWVASVGRVAERIMRVCICATGCCAPIRPGWVLVSWVP